MARRRHSKRRRRGSPGFLYKLLSVLLICTVIIVAMTLFFRVNTIEVVGQRRYSEEEIREASGVKAGDNLYLLNKYDVASRIVRSLPYIENVHPYRRLPDTLVIEVEESGRPFAVVQDGSAWLVSSNGKIVEQVPEAEAGQYGIVSGCELLAPSVGTSVALATEYAAQQSSLLDLLAALDAAGMSENVDGIRLDDLAYLKIDYIGRFTVRIAYSADYARELKKLALLLQSEKVQSNMTGTIDLRLDSEYAYLMPDVR